MLQMTRLLEMRMKTRNERDEAPLGNVLPTTKRDSNVILRYIMYTSAVRFFEGQLPYDTIIPDHDEGQTSPKMTTAAPP